MFINNTIIPLLLLAGLFSIPSSAGFDDALKVISETGLVYLNAPQKAPRECRFLTFRGVCYSPIKLPDDEEACVGVDDLDQKKENARLKHHSPTAQANCGNVTSQDITDIQNAARAVVKKEGWFASATAGKWTARFMIRTTAFASHNITPFEKFLDSYDCEAGNYTARHFYWSRGRHMMLSVMKDGCRLAPPF